MKLHFALITLLALALQAQPMAPPDSISRNAKISLVTVSPGPQLYSTFGHSAFRVIDPESGFDNIFNYGTFDFDQPGFYLKFCRGQLDYELSTYPFRWALGLYEREGRIVVEQELRLTKTRRDSLYQFLQWNYLPANRGYRYDFFFDNCATKQLDVVEEVLGKSLSIDYSHQRNLTFRDYIDQYLISLPFSDFGIDIVLGARTDHLASARQAMFLPDYLFEGIAGATISENGEQYPFVSRTDTLLADPEGYRLHQAFPLASLLTWLILGMALLLSFVLKSGWATRWFDRIFFGICGLFGLIIVLLWWGTEHKVTPENYNLIWLWPTHLAVLFLMAKERFAKIWRPYFAVHALVVTLFLLGWFFWPQRLHPAMLPLMLTLIMRSFFHWRSE